MVMSLVWQVFEPLLFGLVGAEVSVEYMNTKVVGEFNSEDGVALLPLNPNQTKNILPFTAQQPKRNLGHSHISSNDNNIETKILLSILGLINRGSDPCKLQVHGGWSDHS